MKLRGPEDWVVFVDQGGGFGAHEKIMRRFFGNFVYKNCSGSFLRRSASLSWPVRCLGGDCWKKFLTSNLKDINRVFVFNDNPAEVQCLLAQLKPIQTTYVEDGSAPYNEHYIANGWMKRLRYRLILGGGYEFSEVLGTTSYITDSLFSYPSMVRQENSRRPCAKLELRSNYRKLLSALFELTQESLSGLQNLPSSSVDLYILPPIRSFEENEQLLLVYKEKIRAAITAGVDVMVKYHPLDTGQEPLQQMGLEVLTAPQHISAEVLVAGLPNVRRVYGGLTTSMLAVRTLFPDVGLTAVISSAQARSPYASVLLSFGVDIQSV